MTELLVAKGLCKTYASRDLLGRLRRSSEHVAFSGIDLVISRGVRLGIVGESGAGKSALARCLAFLERPSAGEIRFDGRLTGGLSRRESILLHSRVQIVFQDSASALNPRMRVGQIIAEPLLIQREGTPETRREKARELMLAVGLAGEFFERLPLELSGGQRQRVAIARALTLNPQLLILDESLASLDAGTQTSILALLADMQVRHLFSCVLISHDLRLVQDFVDEVVVMRRGQIVERQATADLFARPAHEYTKELLAAAPPVESVCTGRVEDVSR